MSEATRFAVAQSTKEGFIESVQKTSGTYTSADKIYKWYEDNLSSVVKDTKVTKINDGILVRLADGSGFVLIYGGHTAFCPVYSKCTEALKKYNNSGISLYVMGMDGKDIFAFLIGSDKLFETYDACWDGTRDGAIKSENSSCPWFDASLYGCADLHKLCAKLIEIEVGK